MNVIKRDGSSEPWNPVKIQNAVKKAVKANENTEPAITDIILRIERDFPDAADVETIQDIVEQELGFHGNIETLRNFAHYRAERTKARSLRSIISEIYQKHNATILNENGNIDGNTNCAQRDFIASEVCKNWALTEYLPKEIADAHVRGDIYVHDLGFSPAGGYINCCLVNKRTCWKTALQWEQPTFQNRSQYGLPQTLSVRSSRLYHRRITAGQP